MSRSFDKKFGPGFLSDLPTGAGVYFFYAGETILYVGKAKNLRRRLSQYKNANRLKKHRKMRSLIKSATAIRFECCTNDLEACLREVRLIQDLKPKYNIASKFSFMYPYIGTRVQKDTLLLCLTTHPDKYPNYRFFGAFRSRRVTGDAYFSLFRLLRYVYHPANHADLKKEPIAKNSYVMGLRKVDGEMADAVHAFLLGQSPALLEALSLKLLDSIAARAKKAEVQADLDFVERFWKREAKVLAEVIRALSYEAYPVTQALRDILFLNFRAIARAIPS